MSLVELVIKYKFDDLLWVDGVFYNLTNDEGFCVWKALKNRKLYRDALRLNFRKVDVDEIAARYTKSLKELEAMDRKRETL